MPSSVWCTTRSFDGEKAQGEHRRGQRPRGEGRRASRGVGEGARGDGGRARRHRGGAAALPQTRASGRGGGREGGGAAHLEERAEGATHEFHLLCSGGTAFAQGGAL